MNRKIKFRGQKTSTNEWVYGSPICGKNGNVVAICQQFENPVHDGVIRGWVFGVIPETVGQFTGLIDTNGKEIYEGDILVDQGGTSGIVSWNKDDCSFSVNWHDDLFESLYFEDSGYFEIIGNIHDK